MPQSSTPAERLRPVGRQPDERPGPAHGRPAGWRLGRRAARRRPPLAMNAWLRYDVVKRLLPPPGGRILEIGCGQGGVGVRLAERGEYVGLEPDTASAAKARQRMAVAGVPGTVRTITSGDLDPDERFDLVCAFEVLEHIEDDRGALLEWTGHLAPGGWLYLSTPAFRDRYGPMDECAGHFRRYDPRDMHDLLVDAGLSDVEVVVYGGPLGHALEFGRSIIGRRRVQAARSRPMDERTSGSGRLFQPEGLVFGALSAGITLPFRGLQRAFPGSGTALVARGRSS